MGRITQIVHWINANPIPSQSWMDSNYSHFRPTPYDEKMRKEFLSRCASKSDKRRKQMKDIFG